MAGVKDGYFDPDRFVGRNWAVNKDVFRQVLFGRKLAHGNLVVVLVVNVQGELGVGLFIVCCIGQNKLDDQAVIKVGINMDDKALGKNQCRFVVYGDVAAKDTAELCDFGAIFSFLAQLGGIKKEVLNDQAREAKANNKGARYNF